MKLIVFRLILSLAILLWLQSTTFAKDRHNMGIFPYYDPATLVTLHKPLKDFLQSELGVKISMRSSKNFRSFKSQTAEGIYDILITAPHLGRIAETTSGYRWIGFTLNRSHAVFAVKNDSNISSLADLKGKEIRLPPKASIIHHMALKHLRNHGLEPNIDIQIIETNSHNNALKSVMNGLSIAAAFGKPTWDRHLLNSKEKLTKISISEEIPGFAILIHSHLAKEMTLKIRKAMFYFAKTETGKKYYKESGLKGFRLVNEKDFKQLDDYISEIQASRL